MAGRKTFSPGDILQAADVQDYLMDQTVMVFAGTAARSSAIASPTEGMLSYRTDSDAIEIYTGTAWVPAAQAAGAATVTNRNLLYNGAMQVSQRGTSTTGITNDGYRTADRWNADIATCGTWTQTVENDAPTGSGLRKSLKMLCTTADSSPTSTDRVIIQGKLEGQDVQRIRKGTASAQKLTLSFWVKSNVTGTYIAELVDSDNTRQVSATYSISASATWEKKTITFPADTTGAFDNDNAYSLGVFFWLAAGTDWKSGTLNTVWGATVNANRVVGQTNLAAATNNYWQVTGVQLETGDVATDFEFKSYGQELRECQRYYWRSVSGDNYSTHGLVRARSATVSNCTVSFPVTMRAPATAVERSGLGVHAPANFMQAITALTLAPTTVNTAELEATVASGLTTGDMYLLSNNNDSSHYIAFSAEL